MTMVFCHSEASAHTGRGNPFLFTMDDGRGFGPPGSSAPTEGLPKSQQRADVGIGPYAKKGKLPRPPRQRLAKRKARKEELVKFSLCPITSECSTGYRVRRPQQSPARAHVGITSSEQNGLAPHPAARQGASRARNCAATSVFSFDGSTAVFFLVRQKENGGWKARRASPAPPGGVWSPRPTGATLAVCSNGPMYLRHGFRRPNFVPKFEASVMGIGPCGDRGRAAEVVGPYGRNVGGPRWRRGRFPSSLW